MFKTVFNFTLCTFRNYSLVRGMLLMMEMIILLIKKFASSFVSRSLFPLTERVLSVQRPPDVAGAEACQPDQARFGFPNRDII